MTQEKNAHSLVQQTSDTADPLKDELEQLLMDYHKVADELNVCKRKCADLERKENMDIWSTVYILSAIIFFILSLIIWGGFWKSLLRMLICLVVIAIVKRIIYAIGGDHSDEYQSKVKYYNNRINTLQKDADEKHKVIQSKLDASFASLHSALNNELGLPYPLSGITLDNYTEIKRCYISLLRKKEAADRTTDRKKQIEANRAYIDDKLRFVYMHSLRAVMPKNIYGEFKKQLLKAKSRLFLKREQRNMVLRKETSKIFSRGHSEISRISKYKKLLDDDHLTPIINQFHIVSNRNTRSFIFFQDTDKKAQQTKDMNELLKAAKYEYDELTAISKNVSYALNYARGCAYRNVYLAFDLINYIRSSNNGGRLRTVEDSINISSIDATVNVKSYRLNDSAMDSAMEELMNVGDIVKSAMSAIDDKELERLLTKNPTIALGAAAVIALASVGAGLVTYFRSLNANAEAQSKITDGIKAISEGYTEGKSQMLRVIEILDGIVKCNNGFMAIYEPLRKRVFEKGDVNLTQMEFMQLAAAAREYSKVAKSTIK